MGCFDPPFKGGAKARSIGETSRWAQQLLLSLSADVRASDDAIAFEGKVLVFDDSWEHSVANTCNVPRAVLQVVLWHPDAPDRPV